MVALPPALESLALADSHDVDPVPRGEDFDRQPVAFLETLGGLEAKLAQVAQGRELMSLQMAELPAGQALRQNLSEAQLDGGVALPLHPADLGYKTRPSFDQSHGIGCPRLVGNPGHAHVLADQPFHRLSPSA